MSAAQLQHYQTDWWTSRIKLTVAESMGSEQGKELGQYIGIEETGKIQLTIIICSTVCQELNVHACMVCRLLMIIATL